MDANTKLILAVLAVVGILVLGIFHPDILVGLILLALFGAFIFFSTPKKKERSPEEEAAFRKRTAELEAEEAFHGRRRGGW